MVASEKTLGILQLPLYVSDSSDWVFGGFEKYPQKLLRKLLGVKLEGKYISDVDDMLGFTPT